MLSKVHFIYLRLRGERKIGKRNSLILRPLIKILRDPVSTTSSQSLIYFLASVQSRFLRVLLILFY